MVNPAGSDLMVAISRSDCLAISKAAIMIDEDIVEMRSTGVPRDSVERAMRVLGGLNSIIRKCNRQ